VNVDVSGLLEIRVREPGRSAELDAMLEGDR
jgi:hypothetical protein